MKGSTILFVTIGVILGNYLYAFVVDGSYERAHERSYFQALLGLTLFMISVTE